MKPTISIIGAHGKMGKAFSELFRSQGLEVLEVDKNTDLRGPEALSQADITVFSVPISVTPDVIRELAPHAKPGALLTDLTSIKTPALEALQQHAPEGCEIMGLHPMFGPSVVSNLQKQVIAVCPVQEGQHSEWLLKLLSDQGAHLKQTTSERHDEVMSVVQGIIHFSSIATGIAIKKLGFDLAETLDFASPIYRLRLDMCGRVLSQNAQLYAEIAIENPLNKKSVKAYQEAIGLIADSIENHDREEFTSAFHEAADFLGADFTDGAYRRTNELITRCTDIL